MTFKIQQKSWVQSLQESIDYQYWKDQGWLNPNIRYYIPIKSNIFKVGLARLIGSLLAAFMF